MTPKTRRRLEILAPAGITLLVVAATVLLAPLLVAQGWLLKPCGLRAATGLPCLACGGTRSGLAFGEGDWLSALRFNPLVFLGVVVTCIWFGWSLVRAWQAPPPQPVDARRQIRRAVPWLIAAGVAAILNWVYLLMFLPD